MNLIESITFIEQLNINHEKINRIIVPQLQLLVLEQMKPSQEDMEAWECQKDGKVRFNKYISSFFKKDVSCEFLAFAWDYFKSNKYKSRSNKVKQQYIKTFKEPYACKHCGCESGDFEIDHIIPLSLGGVDEVDNLQILCKACNRIKSNQFDYKFNIFTSI